MALKLGDRVRENTSSTGVGGLSLTGAPAGFQKFSSVLSSGDITYYALEENDKFEIGVGTYGSDNLERTTVLSSSNSGDKISLGGSGIVFITYPAGKALFNSENDQIVLGASGLLFSNGTSVKEAKLVELTDVSLSGTPSQNTAFDLNITNKSLSLGDMTGATNTNNVLVGYGAGSGITTAQHNVVIGSESSGMNKTGSRNVYVGSNAGPAGASASTATYDSVAVGCDAGNLIRQQSTVMGYSAGASSSEIGVTAIGYQAGTNIGSYSTILGYQAGNDLTQDYSVCLGYRAGFNSAGTSSVWIGRNAGISATSSTNSIGIGLDAGKNSSATESIYIGDSAGESNSTDNLIFIGNAAPSSNGTLIKGDMSNKRVAIGAADVTLDDTLFVGINSQNDEGIVVKGASSQSSNLTSWKNSSDGVLAAVSPNGIISANGIHATGNGIQIDSFVPASTANKLYRVGSDLYWNGAAVSAAAVGDVANYASGQAIENEGLATYASGQAIENESDIVAVSGIAAYASGVGGGGGDVTTAQLNYVSGVATYSSGVLTGGTPTFDNINVASQIFHDGDADTYIKFAGTDEIQFFAGGKNMLMLDEAANDKVVVNDDGLNINFRVESNNEENLLFTDGANDKVGIGTSSPSYLLDVAGMAQTTGAIVGNSGIVLANNTPSVTTNTLYNDGGTLKFNGSTIGGVDTYTSGVAAYASGQAIENETDIAYVSGIAVYSSGAAAYASGQAIENEGLATYASGQAIENEGLVTYASGNTANISFGSNVEGDMLFHNGTTFVRLPKGANDYILKMNGNQPNWEEDTGGGGDVTTAQLVYVSGIAVHGSGDAVYSSGIAAYASGLAITNESNVDYASGQAIENQNIATYASGQVNIATDGTAEASKALILDSAKSFTGVKDGRFSQFDSFVYSSGVSVGNSGVVLARNTPGSTADTLYNVGGTLYFNGSQLASAGGASAEAQYASGQSIENETDIVYISGIAVYTSGAAAYASGQAISNETDISYVSGVATKTFTITASDSNNYTFNGMGLSDGLDPDLYLHKGHTYYFDKQTASHPFRISATDGGSVYQDADGNNIEISGQGVLKFEVPQNAPDKLYYYCTSHSSNMKGEIYTTNNVDEIIHVSGISAYASGLAITNEAEVTYASGLAITNEGRVNYASGLAITNEGRVNYASGLAITNEGRVNYASGLAITNELNVAYASGQAIENETDIVYISGIAVYTSGVAAYASGQAIENEGLATYASGNTQNITFGSNAEGDLLYHNGTSFIRLPKGTNDYILKMNGNVPNWEAESGGSSLTAGSGVVVDGADRINVHGGTGNLQEIQLTSNNIFTPKMVFTGSGVQDTPVTMKVLSSHAAVNASGTALSFEGTQGQLFGITDNLSSGNIFSVADITGLPLISADASGDVKLGEYGRYVGVGTGVPLYGFDVSSSGQFQKGFVLSNYVPATTTNTLYNEGGTLKFNGSAVGGGVSGDTFATDLKIGRDSQNLADFATTDNKIILRVNNINQVSLTDNVFGPEADSDVDLGTTSLRWKDAYVDSITVTGEIDGDSLDIEGDADINGTTNLDAVDIDGNVQIDGTVTVGVDDTGKDVKFFGATAGSYFEWDESEDRLNLVGAAYVQEAVPANDTPTAEDATITLDLKKGNYHNVSLGNNVTKFEFTNAKRGQRFILRITQNASSAKTVAWTNVDSDSGGTAATVRWAGGGTAPTMSTATSHTDVYGFLCTNNAGSAFDGFVIGQNLPD